MNAHYTISKITVWMAAIAMMALFVFFISDFFGIVNAGSMHPSRKACADFRTWNDAQQDYLNGNSGLDRNRDGIACNALYGLGK